MTSIRGQWCSSSSSAVIKACLVLLAVTVVSAQHFGHSCYNMTASCSDDICKCSCETEIPPVYEVSCPTQKTEHKVRLLFLPGNYFKIECSSSIDDLQYLPTMIIGDVESVGIKGCKLPVSMSLVQLLARFGIHKTKSLFLNSDDKEFPFTREQFKDLNIQRLSLNTRGLKVLPDDFFSEISGIKWLEVKNTKLERGKKSLSILTRLQTLEMPQNNMIKLEDGAFENLTSLERLSLYSNKLQTLGKDDFKGLEKVHMLELLGNHIETIHPDAFLPLTNVKYMGLNKNKFQTLPEGLFRSNQKLEEAKLMYNNISTLPKDLFANLSALTVINFSSSNLKDLPGTVFANSTNITNISLSDNQISELSSNTFTGLRRLQRLELQMNQLSILPKDLLMSCRQLEYLDLSHNLIETFEQ